MRPGLASLFLDGVYLLVLSPFLLGYLFVLVVIRRRGVGSLAERFGRVTHVVQPTPGCRRIWVHAVSVGELEAAGPLLQLLQSDDRYDVVVSTTTASAREVANRRYGADRVFYFPIDLSFVIRRTLRTIAPDLVLLMELEIWPNHVLVTSSKGVPLVVANGRVSDRGFRRMRRVAALFRPFLRRIDRFLVQTEVYAERLRQLGVPEDRVEVLGNLKFDRPVIEDRAAVRESICDRFSPRLGGRWWIAGSTHAGEEASVLVAHEALRDQFDGLGLVLAPRHVERAPEVLELVRARGWSVASYSDRRPAEVIVVDTVGELATLYALADVAFVGGSLVPIGGHNILEPIAAGTPTVHGPHLDNFAAERLLFTEGGASVQVDDVASLTERVRVLLAEDADRVARIDRGFEILAEHRGAARRMLERLDAE